MSIKEKIKTVVTASGNNYHSVAPAFETTPEKAAVKLSRGIKKIDDLIKLCHYCNATLVMECKDGSIIPLNIDDIKD